MERKDIENMIKYCKCKGNSCSRCQHIELCEELEYVATTGMSDCPACWSDKDIDNILDVINKEAK